MKISVVQMNMQQENPEYNFGHTEVLLNKAAENMPDVAVLPEMWNTGFFPKNNLSETADFEAVRTKELLSNFSRKNKVYTIGGSVARTHNGKMYNTCYVFDRNGTNIASYDKIHLFSHMDEDKFFTAGNSFCTFDIDGVKAGVIICYDLRFPELVRRLALDGAEILFIVSQWPQERVEQLKILTKARAVENQMFSILANSCGSFDNTRFAGNSFACDPLGNVIAAADKNETVLTFCIDTSEVENIRNEFRVFDDIRKDLY